MSRLTEDQIAEFQETFNLFDNRGDGKIYSNQIGDVLRALGQNPTEAEVKKCGYHSDPAPMPTKSTGFKKVVREDYRISFEQFLPIYTTVSKNKDTSQLEDFVEGFRVFDKEQNGTISSAELRHLMTSLGERLTDEECSELFQGYEDTQGNINYEDFIKMVLSG